MKKERLKEYNYHILKAGIKSIPGAGKFLEELIYEPSKKRKLQERHDEIISYLSKYKKDIEGNNFNLSLVLEDMAQQYELFKESNTEIKKIIQFLKNPDDSEILQRFQSALSYIVVHNLPRLSLGHLFKGRDDVFEQIKIHFESENIRNVSEALAIHGLAGIGKTRLALEYAWESIKEGRYSDIFFVVADSLGSLNQNFVYLANPNLLDIPEYSTDKYPIIIDAVLKKLSAKSQWLLIFDNVDDITLLNTLNNNFLPRLTEGDVIITSRLANWRDGIKDIALDKIDTSQASEYLIEKTNGKRKTSDKDLIEAKTIAYQLGGLPIALEHAAAYINFCHIGFEAYLKDYNETKKNILSWHKDYLINYPQSVFGALKTTEKHLSKEQQTLLRIFAFFSSESIPISLLEKTAAKIEGAVKIIEDKEDKQQDAESSSSVSQVELIESARKALAGLLGNSMDSKSNLNIRQLLSELSEWSMIDLKEDSFGLHPIVQETFRLDMSTEQQVSFIKVCLDMLKAYILQNPRIPEPAGLFAWKEISSHCLTVISHAKKLDVLEPMIDLSHDFANYLYYQSRYDEAETIMRDNLTLSEKLDGLNSEKVAVTLLTLGSVLYAKKELEEAETVFRRGLAIYEDYYNSKQLCIAEFCNNLAVVLKDSNELEEVEEPKELFRKALYIDEKECKNKVEGKCCNECKNDTVARDCHNLAQLLVRKKEYDEAEEHYHRALSIYERVFVDGYHPYVAIVLDNFGVLLDIRGKVEEAENLLRKAVHINESIFGFDNASVAITKYHLAEVIENTGRIKDAKSLYMEALDVFEKALGNKHPHTNNARRKLAQLKT